MESPAGCLHMAATRLGCKKVMAETRWVGHSHLVGLISGRTLSGCLTAASADYCMLLNEWAWLRS